MHDNWALISSQFIAIKNKVPLYVCFQYVGEYKESNVRHYDFLFKGLEQTAQGLEENNIQFFLLKGKANKVIQEFIESKRGNKGFGSSGVNWDLYFFLNKFSWLHS